MNNQSELVEDEDSWHVENGYVPEMESTQHKEEGKQDISSDGHNYYDERKSNDIRPTLENPPAVPGQTHRVNVGFGQSVLKMSRDSWGAVRPQPRYQLRSPVLKVRFTHTSTKGCEDTEECMKRCQQIQKYYMDLGFPDIPYNFMIGGDGIVYQGRGWMKAADRPAVYSQLQRNCVDIAYIGNFHRDPVPYKMAAAGTDFLKFGIKTTKLSPFFQVHSFLGEKKPP